MIDRVIGIAMAIVGLASLAAVISKRSDTARVADAVIGGYTGAIKVALSPITGK
jgi:hypothetical protein